MIKNDDQLKRAVDFVERLWKFVHMVYTETESMNGLEHHLDEIEEVTAFIEEYRSNE